MGLQRNAAGSMYTCLNGRNRMAVRRDAQHHVGNDNRQPSVL